MMDRVNALIEARKLIQEHTQPIIESLKDTTIPLEERWGAYTALVENYILVNEENYGDGHINILGPNLTMYDDFNIDRYQTTTYPEMYETITDKMEWDEDFGGEGFDSTKIPEWQEHILSRGFSGFQHDW